MNSCQSSTFILKGQASYLTGEHGTEVIATGSQHDAMGREVFLLHPQRHVTQGVALPEGVHGIEDGFSMCICHDVFGGHNASHQAKWRNTKGVLGFWKYKREKQ